MITRLNNTANWLSIFATTITATAYSQLIGHLQSAIGQISAQIIGFLLLLFILKLFQAAIANLIFHFRWLRRVISGRHDIEGFWVDESRRSKGSPVGGACIYIYVEDGILKISGSTVRAQDHIYAAWSSKFAVLNGNTLSYAFEAYTSNSEHPIDVGFGELQFIRGQRRPHSYTGFFFDTTSREIVTVKGTRITDPNEVRDLRSTDSRLAKARENIPT